MPQTQQINKRAVEPFASWFNRSFFDTQDNSKIKKINGRASTSAKKHHKEADDASQY
ncbi:MAG: hypothetical protein IJN24_01410 [Bacteroidaceae bacterium]|nr:hypothetical protein [Bacteroidaceae bacterium]